jgi:hypothetical protein
MRRRTRNWTGRRTAAVPPGLLLAPPVNSGVRPTSAVASDRDNGMAVPSSDASAVGGRGSIGALGFIQHPGPNRSPAFPSVVGPDRALLATRRILAVRNAARFTVTAAPVAPGPSPSAQQNRNGVRYSSPMQVRANKELDRTAHGCRPAWLVSGAAGQFRRSADNKDLPE